MGSHHRIRRKNPVIGEICGSAPYHVLRRMMLRRMTDQLGICVGTVNTRIHHGYEKLHVHSRAEAVAQHLGG
jgi:hypothetical protein